MFIYSWHVVEVKPISYKSLEEKHLKRKNRKPLMKLETIEKRMIGRIIDRYC